MRFEPDLLVTLAPTMLMDQLNQKLKLMVGAVRLVLYSINVSADFLPTPYNLNKKRVKISSNQLFLSSIQWLEEWLMTYTPTPKYLPLY